MTDDFILFGADGRDPDGGPPVDADVALITAFLARELTTVQIAAVEERLATDADLARVARPIIAAWTVHRPGGRLSKPRAARSGEITPTQAEIDAGWARTQSSSSVTESSPRASAPIPGLRSETDNHVVERARPRWRNRMIRSAAVVTLVVLPLVAAAQIVTYVARHPGVPGHDLAARAISALHHDDHRSIAPAPPPIDPRDAADTPPVADIRRPEPFVLMPRGSDPVPLLLGAVVAQSQTIPGVASDVHALRDGRVLIDDARRRTLFVVDATLSRPTVIIDSANAPSRQYGWQPSSLFRGDSVLFGDFEKQAFRVLDPALRTSRSLAATPFALAAAFDGGERWAPDFGIIYDHMYPEPGLCQSATAPTDRCRSALIALHADETMVDTLTTFYSPRYANDYGGTTDRWVVMQDGAVTILDAREGRLGFLNRDHTRRLGPPIANPMPRLDSTGRKRSADSINAARLGRYTEDLIKWSLDSADIAAGRPWTPRLPLFAVGIAVPPGSPPPAPGATTSKRVTATIAREEGGRGVVRPSEPQPIRPSDIPEQMPLTDRTRNALFADMDNHVWVRLAPWIPAPPGQVLYDVLDRTGVLIDRVLIPADKSIATFGRGGIVYLTSPTTGGYTIEKVRVR